jgi:hypothetical protein
MATKSEPKQVGKMNKNVQLNIFTSVLLLVSEWREALVISAMYKMKFCLQSVCTVPVVKLGE